MRAHSSLRLGTLHGTTPELLASPCYCAWGFCMVWEAGLPHKTSSAPPQRRNGRACSSLTARGGGLPVGVILRICHPVEIIARVKEARREIGCISDVLHGSLCASENLGDMQHRQILVDRADNPIKFGL